MKILVAPLDWGLGHATRCIPLIKKLMNEGNEVLIAGDGNVQRLLKEEFPHLKFISLKGYHISYSSKLPAWLKVLIQIPKIIFRIIIEHSQLKNIIDEHNLNMVISDNRFGLWNAKVKSIYITHQVMIKCPRGFKLFELFIYKLHRWIIHHYDECWIPDYGGNENLSGDLSHKYPKPGNAKYIGPLSRFSSLHASAITAENNLCIILSGPEPSRSEFQKIIFHQLKSYPGKAVVILGNPLRNKPEVSSDRIRVFSHLNAEELQEVIIKSKLVLCRAGYSSIMDLIALRKDAVLVPTPGQTEQEYLAEYLQGKKIFRRVNQSDLDLRTLGKDSENFSVRNFVSEIFETSDSFVNKNKQEQLIEYL